MHDGAFHSMTTFGMRKTFERIVEANSAACLNTITFIFEIKCLLSHDAL